MRERTSEENCIVLSLTIWTGRKPHDYYRPLLRRSMAREVFVEVMGFLCSLASSSLGVASQHAYNNLTYQETTTCWARKSLLLRIIDGDGMVGCHKRSMTKHMDLCCFQSCDGSVWVRM